MIIYIVNDDYVCKTIYTDITWQKSNPNLTLIVKVNLYKMEI